MVFKELNPKLQLSFDEYVETWRSLLMEYYTRGFDPDITDKELKLSDEAMIRYSMNLASVVLIIAMRLWKSRTRITEDIRNRTYEAIVDRFYAGLHSDASHEFKEDCIKFFNSRYEIFYEICSNLSNKDAKKRQPELIGLARYLVAQVSERPEQDSARAIEKLSLLFIDTSSTSLRLAENSAAESQMLGKLKFIVQK